MECKVEKINNPNLKSIGAPKEIIVDENEWSADGETGKTYSYHMSKERFERNNHDAYVVTLEGTLIGKLSYYDFVDFNYWDVLSKRALDEITAETGASKDEVIAIVEEQLNPLQDKIREEFKNSEEYIEDTKNRETIEKHKQARMKFAMEYGLDGVKYDRCYNVFGQLMDGEYLEKLKDILKEREAFSDKNSKRKHKDAWRNYTESSFFGGGGSYYEEEDKVLLAKFYKILAKKYHPDSNPDTDTAKEMQLLNRLKKEWGI